MRSIQFRLAYGLLLSLIVLLIGQWLIVAYSVRALGERHIAAQLRHAGDILVAAISVQNRIPSFDTSRIDPVYTKPFSGHYYQIQAANTIYYSRSLWDEKLPLPDVNTGDNFMQRVNGPQSQTLLVLTSRFKKQDIVIHISVAENIIPFEQDINSLLHRHAIVSLLILVLLVTIQYLIIRKSLKPIERIRHELHALDSGLVEKLSEQVPVELIPLVREINIRISAVQTRLQRSRNATGNLAHALKTPLTLINQLAQHEALSNQPELCSQILEHTGNIKSIIDRELKRARLAGNRVGGRQSNIKPELDALIASLRAMYGDKTPSIDTVMVDDCVSTLDREDFHEILGNLLDNACKWAASRVLVSINCNSHLLIEVEDDGPGIPETQRALMLERGQRLDEQVAGHGLGLAIVSDAVQQYDGHISLRQSDKLGGLHVIVNIPLVNIP